MRAATALLPLLLALLAGCLWQGTTPSSTASTGTGEGLGTPTWEPTKDRVTGTQAQGAGLPGVVLHLDAYRPEDGRPGYRFVAVAVNHGQATYDYREGCASAWRFRIERSSGEAIPYGGPLRCQGFQQAKLAPTNSTGDGDAWDGDAIDQGGNREQVAPGTYFWVATFVTEQGNATARLSLTWPPG